MNNFLTAGAIMSQYAATMGATMQMIPIAGFMGFLFEGLGTAKTEAAWLFKACHGVDDGARVFIFGCGTGGNSF